MKRGCVKRYFGAGSVGYLTRGLDAILRRGRKGLAGAAAALNAELWGQARNRLSGLTAQHMAPDVRARAARMLAELESRPCALDGRP